jgi:magnesium transporter
MLMAVCHTKEAGWTRVEDLEQLSDLRAEAGNVLWAETDIANLTKQDIETVAEEFGLHTLAVEDAINTRQRPKLDVYENHLFVVFHQLDEDEDRQFDARQVACFVGERYVLTLHEGASRSLDETKARLADLKEPLESPALVVYTLIDTIVDDYQEKADALEGEIEELEEIVLETPRAPVQRQLYSVKQRLARLRRYVVPGERLLGWVLEPTHGWAFSPRTTELFRDVHDHLLRMVDEIRNVDELSDAVLDLVRTEQNNALSDINKKLSAWAAIFAVGTLIAGIYGMNFALIPKDQSLFGFWFAVGLMAFSSVALYFYFKRKGWL